VTPTGKSRAAQQEDLNHELLTDPVSANIISVVDLFFSDYPKCLDLIFIDFTSPRISPGNPRILKHASMVDKV
jgi:hypothetical protein